MKMRGEPDLSPEDEKIVNAAIAGIPSIEQILSEAIRVIPRERLDSKYIKENFSRCVVELERSAYSIYLEHEKRAFPSMIELWVNQNKEIIDSLKHKLTDLDFVKEICKLFYPLARMLEFRAGQMRKTRGGRTFERILETLLKRIGCECERPSKDARRILKRIDLVIPNQHVALTRPDQAFFLSCKRTLRERWKQTIPERKPAWRVFMVTVDDALPEDKAKEIDQLGIIAYVKDELKLQPHLRAMDWIRKLSDLPVDVEIR